MTAFRLLLAALAPALLAAAPAHAETVFATGADARDGTGGDARDVEQIRSSFDAEAGRWTLTVRLFAPGSEERWAMVNAALHAPGEDGVCDETFSTVRASTRPSSGSAAATAGSAADGPQPDGSQGPSFTSAPRAESSDGRELTLEVSHPRLAGRVPACVSLRMTYENETLDTAGARFPVPAGYEPPPPSAGPTARVAIRLASTRVLRVSRRNRMTAFLRAFDRDLTGTAWLRARVVGPTLARATWRARAGRVVRVRLALTRAGRRHVRRRPSSRVRLTVGARVPAGAAETETFRVRLVGRR